MRKLLYILSLLFSFSALAELNVEWVDENTIVVTGYGYGNVTNDTGLGGCTNCTAITPAELTAGMDVIISNANNIQSFTLDILGAANFYLGRINSMQDDILTFRRFDGAPETIATSVLPSFTNYTYTVENTQTLLTRQHPPSAINNAGWSRMLSYSNGIYDYATQYVSPELSSMKNSLVVITNESENIMHETEVIKSTAGSFRNLPSCQSCGVGETNDTSCSSCPCEEQWLALLDYVRHIDEDQHKRHIQLNQISNNVFNIDKQFDSYARLVSGAFYNDATIVVDDGANSWSNVYSSGHSDLYDYNKSNILQRIELLLFGISYNTSTNWGDVTSDLDSSVSDVQDNFNDAKSYVEDANDEYTDQVNDLSGKFSALWQAMCFFGAGSLSNFSLAEPSNTFGLYEMNYDFEKSADLSDLQRISRTCFQIFYWSIGVVFMLVFWWKVVTFTVGITLRVVRFFNVLIT